LWSCAAGVARSGTEIFNNRVLSARLSPQYLDKNPRPKEEFLNPQRRVKRMVSVRRANAALIALLGMCGAAFGVTSSWAEHLRQAGEWAGAGRFADAEQAYLRALPEAREDRQIATTLNNLGLFYQRRGRYAQAGERYRQAITVCDRQDNAARECAGALHNLAELDRLAGSPAEAVRLFQKALAIKEVTLGPEHVETAETLNSLASAYVEQRSLTRARRLYERALAIFERERPSAEARVAAVLANLANLNWLLHESTAALALLRRALEIQDRVYGPQSRPVALTLNSMGAAFYTQRDYAESERCLRMALEIGERVLPVNDPDYAVTLSNLAHLMRAERRFEQAESYWRRSIAAYESRLGRDDSRIAALLDGLSAMLRQLRRTQEARALERRAREIRAHHPADQPSSVVDATLLAVQTHR
jgi:tetratricopeptide (TPR) repeat protein